VLYLQIWQPSKLGRKSTCKPQQAVEVGRVGEGRAVSCHHPALLQQAADRQEAYGVQQQGWVGQGDEQEYWF
jgi:hypothetical protein